jgi:CoA binding protein
MRLDALLRPRSIAILGASERASIGRALMESAATLDYEGRLYPINPSYTEILEQRRYPGMRELPEQPDVVALCVSCTRVRCLYALGDFAWAKRGRHRRDRSQPDQGAARRVRRRRRRRLDRSVSPGTRRALMDQLMLYATDDTIGIVTLNRPSTLK